MAKSQTVSKVVKPAAAAKQVKKPVSQAVVGAAGAAAGGQISWRAYSRDTENGIKRIDSYKLDPLRLVVDRDFNIRHRENPDVAEQIEGFKASICAFLGKDENGDQINTAENGLSEVFPAIEVFLNADGLPQVWDGHTRMAAIIDLIKAGWRIDFVEVNETAKRGIDLRLAMLRANNGLPNSPLEKAKLYREMADDGLSQAEIVAKLESIGQKVTPQRVEQLLLMSHSPESVLSAVAKKLITADTVIELCRRYRDDPDALVAEVESLISKHSGTTDDDGEGVPAKRPVGRSTARPTISKKVTEDVFTAIGKNSNKLALQLERVMEEAVQKGEPDSWKDEDVTVTLPASVLADLMARHKEFADK